MEFSVCMGYIIIGIISSPSILQGCGVYGTEWIEETSCSVLDNKPSCCNDVSSGLATCHGPFGLSELNGGVYTLQYISLIILITPFVCVMVDVFCSDDDNAGYLSLLGGFCFLLYPIAGLFSFIGCMVIAGEYAGQSFGSSFNLCLTVGICVLLITGMVAFFIYFKAKGSCQGGNRVGTVIQRSESVGAAAPYGDEPQAIHAEQVEETVVAHDPESGGFFAFVRKVNVYHNLRR